MGSTKILLFILCRCFRHVIVLMWNYCLSVVVNCKTLYVCMCVRITTEHGKILEWEKW